MRKLLRANLVRLFRSVGFWIIVVLQLFFTVLVIHIGRALDLGYYMETGLREMQALEYRMACAFIGFPFFQAAFVSFFLGTEKKEGTFRNKLSVGHTRLDIYLSNFITCLVGTTVLFVAWFLGSLLEIPYVKVWRIGVGELLALLALYLFSAAAGTAVYVMMAHICVYGSSLLLINLLITGMLLLEGFVNYGVLKIPEMKWIVRPQNEYVEELQDWKQLPGQMEPNPEAVLGIRRKIYLAIESFVPSGQHLYLKDKMEFKNGVERYYQTEEGWFWEFPKGHHPYVELSTSGMFVGSVVMIIVFSIPGILLFRRENLK